MGGHTVIHFLNQAKEISQRHKVPTEVCNLAKTIIHI